MATNMLPDTFTCPECGGRGDVECDGCCGCEHDCDYCDGTGLDPEKFDVPRLNADGQRHMAQHGSTHAKIVDDTEIGRECRCGDVMLYSDYRKPRPSE